MKTSFHFSHFHYYFGCHMIIEHWLLLSTNCRIDTERSVPAECSVYRADCGVKWELVKIKRCFKFTEANSCCPY